MPTSDRDQIKRWTKQTLNHLETAKANMENISAKFLEQKEKGNENYESYIQGIGVIVGQIEYCEELTNSIMNFY